MSKFRSFDKFRSRSSLLSAELSGALFEKSNDGIILTDSLGKCRQVNIAACRMMGYTRDEFLRLPFADVFTSRKTDASRNIEPGKHFQGDEVGEMIISRKDGAVLRVQMEVHALQDGSYVSILRDISAQKDAEKELDHLLRLYETLNRINSAILHAGDRDSLFQEICSVAADSGRFNLAAVGLLDERGETLRLTAWKGVEQKTPPYEELSLNFQPSSSALVTRAVKSGRVASSDDLQTDRASTAWHDEAVRRNLHSAAAVPFGLGGKIIGVLSLVAAEKGSFKERDFQLLEAIAQNITFALEGIKAEDERRLIEDALVESEERYRSAFENTSIGLYRTTPDGRILMANRALIWLLGFENLEQLQQRNLQKEGFRPNYSREEFISKIESEGSVLGLEASWTRTDGRAIFVRESARAVRGPDGKTLYYEGSIEDITDKKLAEQTISEKNFLMDAMSHMAKIGGWEFSTDDMSGNWTDETARIHGVDPSAGTNAPLGLDFYEGEHRRRIESAVRDAIETGRPYDLELELKAADGTRKWVRTIGHPIEEGGRIVKIRGTFQDITEAKLAKDRIWYLTRLYATLSQVNQTIVRTKEREELYRQICSVALEFGEFPLVAIGTYDKARHSIELAEWKGMGIAEKPYSTIDIDLPQYIDGLLSTAIRGNRVVTSADVPAVLETKHWRDVLLEYGLNVAAAVPFRFNGEVVGALTIYARESDIFMPEVINLLEEMGLDISFALDSMGVDEERRKSESALAEERDRIAMVAEMAPGLIHSLRQRPDGTACMPYASSAILDTYGFSHEEVVNDLSPIFDHIHPDDLPHVKETFAESARSMSVWHAEYRYMHPAKGEIWIEGKSKPVREQDGSITWHGFVQDITDRKTREEALQESEERFRSIAEQMTDTLFLTRSDGTIAFVSPYCLTMFGYSPGEMIGRPFTDFLLEDDTPFAVSTFRNTQQTGRSPGNLELRMKRKDGRIFYSELSSSYYISDRFSGSMGVIRDITERKKAEKELKQNEARRNELERQLIQAQKLESLGTLAGGIAHDFNNLLGIIMGYSTLLREGNMDAAKAAKSMEAIDKASERGAALVKQLLTFARKTETIFTPVSINEVITETTKLLSATFPKSIIITSATDDSIPQVVGDRNQLNQVLMNLCINARDALPQGGSVVIESARAQRKNVLSQFPGGEDREYILVRVTDNGIGMDEEIKRKIFDPFFTTKGAGKGTGLGLALVYSIIRDHGGFVGVESEPGKGTSFSVYLPSISVEPETASTADPVPSKHPVGHEKILVVEDEEMLLEMLNVVLTQHGYSVTTARNGREALEVFAHESGGIGAVITDLGLPGLSGDQVFLGIRSIDPGAKVMIASGFVDPEVRARLAEAGAKHFIQKPYVPGEILSKLRSLLDSR